jgi:hypothetical protein
MKLKLLYLIVTSLLLGGCVSYDSISNSHIQENLEFKGKPSKPPVKIIETSPVFNEVIGAFGVTLEETSNLPTLKSGIKFIPGSHPSYLSDFRYFTNDDNIIFKITTVGEFLEWKRSFSFISLATDSFTPYECNSKQNELVKILMATYENKTPKKGKYGSSKYTYYNSNALHKNKIIIT